MSVTWLAHDDGESTMRYASGPDGALEWLKEHGWRECTEAEAREIIRRVDAANPEPPTTED